ncbi:15037_t:CDS:1, partial [Acaulospora morrowiae]
NVKEFLEYLKKSANNGDSKALYNLGDLYVRGKLGVRRDEKKGIEYLRLSALKGHTKSISVLKELGVEI